MTLQDVAAKIQKAKSGTYKGLPKYTGLCPAHEDKEPSFAVWEGADGWLHGKCQKGCTEESWMAALGMSQNDRRLKEPLYTNGKPEPVDYEYTDQNGFYLFTKRRSYTFEAGQPKKKFLQLVKNPDGSESFSLSSLGSKSKSLYRLPEVLTQVEAKGTVYVCEGEKAVESFRKQGLVATCQPGGSGHKKWLPVHTAWLADTHVVIVADRDPRETEEDGSPKFNGEDYAREVYESLRPQTLSCKVVSSATLGAKHDAWDHFDAGHKASEFVHRPDLEGFKPAPTLRTLAEVAPEEPKFLWDDWRYIRDEQCTLLDAKGASGKTTLIIALAACGSNGVSPTGSQCEPFSTLYYGNEDSEGEIRSTFDEIGGDPSKFVPVSEPFSVDEAGAKAMGRHLEEVKPKLVVLDPAKAFLPTGKAGEFDNPLVNRFYGTLRKLAREHSCAFLLVRHFTRYAKDRDMLDQGAGISAWSDCARSQIVMLRHPEKPRNSVVWHLRGSLRGALLEPFGCGFASGEYGFWHPTDEDLALFGMDSQGRKLTGRPATATAEAEELIRDFLRDGPRLASEVLSEADNRGVGRSSVYRTADKLKVNMTRGVWKLYDPYDD